MYRLSPNAASTLPTPEEALIRAEKRAQIVEVLEDHARPRLILVSGARVLGAKPRRMVAGCLFALEELGDAARNDSQRVQLQRLLAAHLGETSQTDLAAHLGVTQQAVSLRLQRALATLRWAATLESWPACPARMRRDLSMLGEGSVDVAVSYWDARFCAARAARALRRPRSFVVDRLRGVQAKLGALRDDRSAGPYARDLDRVRERYARE